MKAAPFEYARAESLADACEKLAEYGADAKLIAGGQSLVPMMAMRLVRVSWLVDIHEIAGLRANAPGRIGACVRQRELERSAVPLIAQALRFVGHVQTRNRGTIGGSLAHADPSAELPLALATLGASVTLARRGGSRKVPVAALFTGPMSTSIAPDEVLSEIEVPPPRGQSAFDEVAIRHGDFAIVAAAAQVELDSSGRCVHAALGLGGAGPTPLVFPQVAQQLVGATIDEAAIEGAADAVARECDPGSDLHATADYRRSLARVLAARVLRKAAAA